MRRYMCGNGHENERRGEEDERGSSDTRGLTSLTSQPAIVLAVDNATSQRMGGEQQARGAHPGQRVKQTFGTVLFSLFPFPCFPFFPFSFFLFPPWSFPLLASPLIGDVSVSPRRLSASQLSLSAATHAKTGHQALLQLTHASRWQDNACSHPADCLQTACSQYAKKPAAPLIAWHPQQGTPA